MRCLYCGKELALLKRWTGGGEFCSDAHRQQYQEEYNQLALNRLLQAKPPGEAKSQGGKTPASAPATTAEAEVKGVVEVKGVEEVKKPEPVSRPKVEPIPAPAPASAPPPFASARPPVISAPVVEPRPALKYSEPDAAPVMVEDEERAPAELGGFLVEIPVVATLEAMEMARPETDFERNTQPTLPAWNPAEWGTQLVAAGRITLELPDRIVNYNGPGNNNGGGERRLEARESGHSAPILDFKLAVASEAGLLRTSEEPMDFLVFPHPPQGSPPLWQEAEKEFAFDTELGVLARVAFGTTGLQDNEEGNAPAPVATETAAAAVADSASQIAEAAADSTASSVEPEVMVEPGVETKVESGEIESGSTQSNPVESKPVESKPPVLPAPVMVEAVPQAPSAEEESRPTPTPAAVTPKLGFLRSTLAGYKPTPETPAAKILPEKVPASPKKSDRIPDLVKKPLPLTLHGLAAGRGKPVQVISSAVATGVELQVPRSNAVPMRPVMILGSAPAAAAKSEEKPEAKTEAKKVDRTVVVKTDPKKIQPVRADPRFETIKGRKPEVPVSDAQKKEPEKKEPEKREPEKPAAAAVKEPAAKPVEVKKPAASRQETAPYTPPDLELPSLSFQDSGNFFTKLPMPVKIGIVAGAIVAIGGLIALGMKGGNGAAASSGPRVVSGQPLPALDSGWITDWGAEPGVRRQHEISILRPSMSITDYRLEFEAQIEAKAIGWVYRAQDPKNYYVSKLEIVKPGLEPTVALIRFAVINGEEQPRSQFPLKIPLRIDTLYKIRFDAVGDHFTTWVQDQQVDDWTDDHLKRGGVGLYNERGERMSLRGSVNVVPLVIKR